MQYTPQTNFWNHPQGGYNGDKDSPRGNTIVKKNIFTVVQTENPQAKLQPGDKDISYWTSGEIQKHLWGSAPISHLSVAQDVGRASTHTRCHLPRDRVF